MSAGRQTVETDVSECGFELNVLINNSGKLGYAYPQQVWLLLYNNPLVFNVTLSARMYTFQKKKKDSVKFIYKCHLKKDKQDFEMMSSKYKNDWPMPFYIVKYCLKRPSNHWHSMLYNKQCNDVMYNLTAAVKLLRLLDIIILI